MEERVIMAVYARPELWDKTSSFYRDRNRKAIAWRRVSEEVGVSEEVCRVRWKSLRDTDIRESRKERERRDRSGGAAATGAKWRYLALLSFLEPSVAPRHTSGNMSPRRAQEDQEGGRPEEPVEEAAGLSGELLTQQPESSLGLPGPTPAAASTAGSSAAETSVQAGPSSAAPPPGPRKRGRKRRHDSGPTEWQKEMLDTLRAIPEAPPAAPPRPLSEDEMFLLSLVPLLQKVPPQSKDYVKFQIHKLIYDNSTVLLNLERLEPTE
ncbi:transcription factor Adf-1-like [Salarias fasciatus]|uniref:transcription factor Adf-1-like n=1 Tax=Salarias fasciatus TaxID=181472 RepID=UPI0011770D61|nr:transcription factor Adf-1-like [Salarias fasciatus]